MTALLTPWPVACAVLLLLLVVSRLHYRRHLRLQGTLIQALSESNQALQQSLAERTGADTAAIRHMTRANTELNAQVLVLRDVVAARRHPEQSSTHS